MTHFSIMSWVRFGLTTLTQYHSNFLDFRFPKVQLFSDFENTFIKKHFFFSGMRMAAVIHIYYLSKPLEFLDTIFFVATKKFRNVSKLQVIHHAVMPFFTFCLVRWLPNGNFTFYFAYFIFKMPFPRISPSKVFYSKRIDIRVHI